MTGEVEQLFTFVKHLCTRSELALYSHNYMVHGHHGTRIFTRLVAIITQIVGSDERKRYCT